MFNTKCSVQDNSLPKSDKECGSVKPIYDETKSQKEEDVFAFNPIYGSIPMSEFKALFIKTIVPLDNENPETYEQFFKECNANKEISQAISVLENSVANGVETWSHDLEPDLQEAMNFYYKLLKGQNPSKQTLSNLTEEESALLEMAEDFDIENLNVFKDISREERELLSLALADTELDNSKQSLQPELQTSPRTPSQKFHSLLTAATTHAKLSSGKTTTSNASSSTTAVDTKKGTAKKKSIKIW